MEEAYDEAFDYDWTQRGENLLADRAAQFDAHMFPLAVVGHGGWELPNWVQDYEKHWRAKEAGPWSQATRPHPSWQASTRRTRVPSAST